jgi:Ferritin-like domain
MLAVCLLLRRTSAEFSSHLAMKLLRTCALLASISMAFATPLRKREVEINDGLIANYALTLEFLEAEFYREALLKFNQSAFDAAGFPGVHENVVRIFSDEKEHIKLLQGLPSSHASLISGAIKAAGLFAVKQCNYTFPMDDVASFMQLAQVIEG